MADVTRKLAVLKLCAVRMNEVQINFNNELDDLLKGRMAEVLTDFNGQPYGQSRPSLRGKVKEITYTSAHNGKISVMLDGTDDMISIDDVRIIGGD